MILDEVLADIAAALASRSPERGGLLFGPPGQKLITYFAADEEAEHHYGTYTPSAAICQLSPEIEREHGLEYKGLIHSHPGSMDRPSMPDIDNARRALGENPHLSYFMMPIVTLGEFDISQLGSHELALPGGKLSHWIVTQASQEEHRRLSRDRVTALTLWSDLGRLASQLPGQPKVARSSMLDIEGVSAAAYQLDTAQGSWMFVAAAGYPFIPPLVVPPAGANANAALRWDLEVSADRRLQAAAAPLLDCLFTAVPESKAMAATLSADPPNIRLTKNGKLVALCGLLAVSSAAGSLIAGLLVHAFLMPVQESGRAPEGHAVPAPAKGPATDASDIPPKLRTDPSSRESDADDNPWNLAAPNPLMEFFNGPERPEEMPADDVRMFWSFPTDSSLDGNTRP